MRLVSKATPPWMPSRTSSSGNMGAHGPPGATPCARFIASTHSTPCSSRQRRATTSASAWFPPCELYL